MNLEDLIAVSGLPGLYRMAANRSNGLIVENLETGKRRFVSARKHQFTPLGSIAIFTDDGDSVELANVFRNMRDQYDDRPPVATNAKNDELFDYFADVLPNYDPDRVYPGDVKKVIKWFNSLKENGLLAETEEEE
ncbi:MAG: DUF5606 domain-containing protein [Bacteroidota bacterium]